MGRRDARGLGQNSDFGTIYLHYTIVSRKSQIKMRTRRAKSPCFSARGGREIHFGVFFSKTCKKILFCPFLPADFSTLPPPATTVSTGKCGKLCGNCEKPLSPCGFSLSPVFTMAFVYVNEPAYCLCPPYFVSSGKGQISFPQFVHRDLTYISYLALGAVRPGWKTVQTQRNPYAIPRFCGILAAKPRVFRRVFTKAPQRAACFPRKTRNVYLCTKFVEHRIGRFFP